MSRKALARAIAAAVSLAAILAIAGTAAAQRVAATGYTVQPLVSDQMGECAHDRREARQPLGDRRRTDDAVVGREQRHQHVHRLQRRRASRSRRPRRSSSSVPGSPTGTVFNGGSQFLMPSAHRACRPPGSSSRPRAGHDPQAWDGRPRRAARAS